MHDYAVRTPAPALRPYVAGYTGYRTVDEPPEVHRGLPSPWVTVILTLDDPLHLTHASFDALVGGLHRTPVLIHHDGQQSGIQLAVRPLGCRALFGLPAGELSRADLHLGDVVGAAARRMREQLLDVLTWEDRFDLLDRLLLGWIQDVPPPLPSMTKAVQALGRGSPVGRTADELGLSARRLQQLMVTETGLAPKAYARVARFDRARRLLPHARSLAGLAHDLGYADQSHLTREFTAHAGLAPTAWLAAEGFRNVHDDLLRAGE